MAGKIELRIEPADVLEFSLDTDEDAPQAALRLTNAAADGAAAAFKVKTTKPKRFLVRPNQGVVPAGATETVRIILLAQEKRLLLKDFEDGVRDDGNKFLVQMVPLSEQQYATYRDKDARQQTDDLTELWTAAAEQPGGLKQKKLRVQFGYPPAGAAGARPQAAGGGMYEAADGVRERMSRAEASQQRGGAATDAAGRAGAGGTSGIGDNQRLWDELRTLRKKYDDLVAFTVNLTAEKDLIQRSLDAAREDLQREGKLRRQLETRIMEGARPSGKAGAASDTASGFGLMHVLLAALLAFLGGRLWAAY